jgi:hypothetical protein
MSLALSSLRVIDLPAPAGTPARPCFGWHLTDLRPNQIQTGYQLLAAASRAQLEADSGAPSFVTGLLSDADRDGAHWIRRDADEADDDAYNHQALSLPVQPVARALVFVTAVHNDELHLNGQRGGAGQRRLARR